jgi:hypothetical protein
MSRTTLIHLLGSLTVMAALAQVCPAQTDDAGSPEAGVGEGEIGEIGEIPFN